MYGTVFESDGDLERRGMRNKRSKGEKREGGLPVYRNIPAAVCGGLLLVLPWFSRLRVWKLSNAASMLYENDGGYHYDLVLRGKAEILIAAGIFLLLFLAGENIFPDRILRETPLRDRKNRWIFLCAAVYAGTVILSAVFSEYREDTLWGSPEEGEGVLVLLSYLVLFLSAADSFYHKRTLVFLKRIMTAVMAAAICLACVEYFYRPLFEIPLVQELLASEDQREYLREIENVMYRNFVTLTFYNPNYFGGFCLLLLPFAVRNTFDVKGFWSFFYGILSAGMVFCVVAAKSTASFYLALAEMAGMLLSGFLEGAKEGGMRQFWRSLAVLAGCVLAVLALVSAFDKDKFLVVTQNLVTNKKAEQEVRERFVLTDIRMEGNTLALCSGETELVVKLEEGEICFCDQAGVSLDFAAGQEITFSYSAYRAVSVVFGEGCILFELGYDDPVCFYMSGDRFYGVGPMGEPVEDVLSRDIRERFGAGFYGRFTGRGYAWVETLSILPEVLLTGKGAGCFAYYFPQNDYVGLLNTHGTCRVYITKPHSMYLQTAVNQGVAGAAAQLMLFSLCAVRFWNTRRKYRADAALRGVEDSCFAACAAFWAYGALNDSIVTVSPFFWMLLGVFLSADYAIRRKKV